MASKVKSEEPPVYRAMKSNLIGYHEDEIIGLALSLLRERCEKRGKLIESPEDARKLCVLYAAGRQREVFTALFLDTRHRLLAAETMFLGTIDSATVHPREVVKRALELNAAAVIFTHNHPSGSPEPSSADQVITRRLVEACKLVDVRVLDHIVVGGADTVSMAERGLM